MSGFFGAGVFKTGVILGNLLAKGGQFGPIFRVPVIVPSGNQVTFQLQSTPSNSAGPYDTPVASATIAGVTVPPIPSATGIAPLGSFNVNPVVVNGQNLSVAGSIGDGPIWYYSLCLVGNVPQAHFTQWTFTTVSANVVVLTSASALFNTQWTGVGFSIWAWPMPFTGLPQDLIQANSDNVITWP